jgi:toxin-antitoxin system PIN domain toxin
MILVDVNLLVYAYNKTAPQHTAARKWFEALISGDEPFLLSWHSILGFLRIATNSRAAENPYAPEEAVEIVDQWLSHPHVKVAQPGDNHWRILRALTTEGQCRGQLVPDAHLAALAIEHGARLATHDRGFARFTGLDVLYPLA